MKINKMITSVNRWCGREGHNVEWIVLHYTANTYQPDLAKNECAAFYDHYVGSSAHYFVDTDEIWQSVEIADTAWHCGDAESRNGCINRNSIGIEMCVVYKDGVYSIPDKTVENAAWLVCYLLEMFPDAQICRHYDVTGKRCPMPWVDNPKLWKQFQTKIYEERPMTKEEKKAFNALKGQVASLASITAANTARLDTQGGMIADLDEQAMPKYNTVEACPKWAKPTVAKLKKSGYLEGVDDKGNLALTEDLTRTLVIVDRAGGFDK